MVKKINEDGVLIKKMIDKGYKPKYITKNFGFKKQKISYWKNTPIKKEIHRRSKLSDEDINEIIKMAENQTTSNMGCRKIASIMNENFKTKGSNLRVSKATVCRILKKYFGKPRKMKSFFVLKIKKKKKESNFVK